MHFKIHRSETVAIESAALFLIVATVADELLSNETRPTIQSLCLSGSYDPSRDQPLPIEGTLKRKLLHFVSISWGVIREILLSGPPTFFAGRLLLFLGDLLVLALGLTSLRILKQMLLRFIVCPDP